MKIYLWVLHICGLALSFLFGNDLTRDEWEVSLLFGFLSILALWGLITLYFKENFER